MQVRVKLLGRLKEKTPQGGRLELPDGSTVEKALAALDIATDGVQAFSINGEIVRDRSRVLRPEDELTVLAPVSGG